MIIISDSSPLIAMARIHQLDLLHRLYGELLIPTAVWEEVVVEGAGQPGSEELPGAEWIARRSVSNSQLVNALRLDLGAGESEAIVLALETPADLLLMDERLGRETARHLGLRCTGLLGTLTEAKHKHYINAIKPLLDALCFAAGFRISEALYTAILQHEAEL